MDLKTARFMKKMTQQKLEKMTGVTQPEISWAETGTITLKPEQKKVIEKALNLKGQITWTDE